MWSDKPRCARPAFLLASSSAASAFLVVATALAAYPSLLWLKTLVEVGAIAGLSSVILVMLMGQPRIFYSMSY